MYRMYDDMKQCLTMKQIKLMNKLRRLWIEHVMWTRSYIMSKAFNLADLDAVTKRLLRNPEDFANALKSFYSEDQANEFKALLAQHLLIAAQLVTEAKAGNTQKVEQLRKQWFENADDIAGFLTEINPNWNKRSWQTMLYDHLNMTENEAVLILKGQYPESIAQYDAIQKQALKMADEMFYGILRQFYI